MAFTQQEIETALQAKDHSGYTYARLADLQASVNYQAIIDYLTGQSKSLSGLQPDYTLYYWQSLKNLITDPEQLTADDQLVLDVIFHPVLWRQQHHSFYRFLIYHLLKKPTDKMFESVQKILKKGGAKEAEIFDFLVCGIGDVEEHLSAIDNTPIKNFLVKQVKQHSKIVYPSQGERRWNQFYFELLEDVNPRFAETFSLYGMYSVINNPAVYFTTYRNGKYLPGIISFLTNNPNPDPTILQLKFSSAIRLYESDQSKFTDLIVTVSKQYLEYFIEKNFPPNESYSSSQQLSDLKITSTAHSNYAIHFLLRHSRQQALQLLDKWVERGKYFEPVALSIIRYHLQEGSFKYIEHSIKRYDSWQAVNHTMEAMKLFRAYTEPGLYLPMLWSFTNHKSKQVRELAARMLAEKDPGAEAKAIALLENKNADTRVSAAKILSHIATPDARQAIATVVDKEPNDNVRDILLTVVMENLPQQADEQRVKAMVDAAAKRGKLNKPVEDWLAESSLPPLYNVNGERVPDNITRFLLYRMSRIKDISSDMEARHIIPLIDKERSAEFSLQLIHLFNEKNGKPEYKYLMVLAALLGNDDTVDKIRFNINRWIDESRYKMAEYGVGALALQGSDKALRWVEWYSRKYKNKKANIGAAALAALENAAEELGISAHELGDKIVPDFGFEGLFKHFTVDGAEYRAFIDNNFKIAFFNEDNKKLKSIPANADAELKEEFKATAKEVRDIVKSQSPRLEYYLIIQRRWPFEKWQQFFLQNPIMFIYAIRLLWGVYDQQGNLVQTFICNEDTSLQDIQQEEFSPDPAGSIGIVHPSQLSAEQLQQWRQIFFDLALEPIFPQLDRRIPDMEGISLASKIVTKYEGKQMKEGSTRSTLERYGWRRGGVGDAGSVISFNLSYPEKKLEAVLEVDGIFVVYGFGTEERLGRLYIRDITIENKSYLGRQETDPDLVALRDVPTIFVQEMLAAIEAITPKEN